MSAMHMLKKLLCITGQIKAGGAVDNGYLSDIVDLIIIDYLQVDDYTDISE
jgi:hypothetical protein